MDPDKLYSCTFLTPVSPYNAGEVAGFNLERARMMAAKGWVTFDDPDQLPSVAQTDGDPSPGSEGQKPGETGEGNGSGDGSGETDPKEGGETDPKTEAGDSDGSNGEGSQGGGEGGAGEGSGETPPGTAGEGSQAAPAAAPAGGRRPSSPAKPK